jgi:hypothetical protein
MKRPPSPVTTILMKFVGRSLVSAMTQTPTSGPDAPCTTPVMYPVAGAGPPRCASRTLPGMVASATRSPAMPAHRDANPSRVRVDLLIRFLLKGFPAGRMRPAAND